jgi:hypothetical protein
VAGEQYLSLPVLREQAPKIVARTFSDIICIDLWRPIDHTLQKHEGSSLLDNLYRFRDKQCSDELDIVYSICSISTDATKVPVQYGISRAQLGRNILRSFGDDLCLWRTSRVVSALRLTEKSDWPKSRAFVNIRMKLSVELEACSTCDTELGEAKTTILDELEDDSAKTFLSCTKCNHTKSARLPHLILAATQTPQGLDWHLFRSNGKGSISWAMTREIELCLTVQMLSWESDVAVLQLSLRDLIRLLHDFDAANQLGYVDRQSTNDGSHALECDWSVPNET